MRRLRGVAHGAKQGGCLSRVVCGIGLLAPGFDACLDLLHAIEHFVREQLGQLLVVRLAASDFARHAEYGDDARLPWQRGFGRRGGLLIQPLSELKHRIGDQLEPLHRLFAGTKTSEIKASFE